MRSSLVTGFNILRRSGKTRTERLQGFGSCVLFCFSLER